MADLIQIDNFINKYNDNLLSENSLLKNNPTVNFSSGTGSYSITNDNSYSKGSNCIQFTEVQNVASGSEVVFDLGNSLEYTVQKDASYIFQFSVYDKVVNASGVLPIDFKLKLYINSILIETYTKIIDINALEELKYYTFAQSFLLQETDIVNFAFEFSGASVGTPNPNFTFNVGGFKLEVDDKFTGLPTPYSLPSLVSSYNLYTGFASYTDSGYTSGAPFSIPALTDTVLPNRAQTIYDTQLPIDIKTFYYSRQLIMGSITGAYLEGETITGGTSGATATIIEIDSNGHLLLVNQNGTWTASEIVTGSTSGATAPITTIKQGAVTGRNGDGLDIMLYFYAVPTNVAQTMDVWLDLTDGTGVPSNLSVLYPETYTFPKGVGIGRGIKFNFSSVYTRDTWQANGGRIFINSSHSLTVYGINFNFDRSHKAR